MLNFRKIKEQLVDWIKDWFEKNGPDSYAVIGISGGKDSTIAAALCVEALGKERVFGVLMPNGEQSDFDDATRVVEHLDIPFVVFNINETYNSVLRNMSQSMVFNMPDDKESERRLYRANRPSAQTRINLAPRLRMATLYAFAQSIGGRVINTSNLSELSIGYFTRWGDGVGDVSLFRCLTKGEVIEIGLLCDLPEELVLKAPADGLTGKTDEENFGFTYEELDKHIRRGTSTNPEADKLIRKKMSDAAFKRNPNIPSFFPMASI